MELSNNKEKQESYDLAEDSREIDWKYSSFVAEIFKGNFIWKLIHPFPAQNAKDKIIGDEFINKVSATLKAYINPNEIDKTGIVPKKALEELAKIGCFGMKISKEYGGLGLSVINYNRVMSLIGSYCGSTAVWLSAHQSIGVGQPLKMFGTEEQRQKYFPRLAKGAISAFALTEPGAGSDPANMKTTAVLSEDKKYYILNGEKMWITNGPDAEILVVMAQTAPKIVHGKEKKQITAFIIETSSIGFEVPHRCTFMGIRGISNGILRFNNIKVPAENIIGKEGEGLKIALVTLNTGRLTIPAAVTGMSKLCLKYIQEWVNKRIQWGEPIGKHQAIVQKNAFIVTNTFAMEAITWLTSAFADNQNKDIRLEAAMAKYFCTETAWKIIDETLQIRGGRGYETEESLGARGEDPVPIERMLRDTRINRIIEGTSEIMQLFIAREAMDIHVKKIMPLMSKYIPLGQKLKLGVRAVVFYSWWYPKQWFCSYKIYKTSCLNSQNKKHLYFISQTSKKLARNLFKTMAIYQQSLEHEQIVLNQFVDIGTNLFAMAATLSYTDYKLTQNSQDLGPQEMANLFCLQAKDKIQNNFKALSSKHNHKKLINKVGKDFFKGNYNWLQEGIIK